MFLSYKTDVERRKRRGIEISKMHTTVYVVCVDQLAFILKINSVISINRIPSAGIVITTATRYRLAACSIYIGGGMHRILMAL